MSVLIITEWADNMEKMQLMQMRAAILPPLQVPLVGRPEDVTQSVRAFTPEGEKCIDSTLTSRPPARPAYYCYSTGN